MARNDHRSSRGHHAAKRSTREHALEDAEYRALVPRASALNARYRRQCRRRGNDRARRVERVRLRQRRAHSFEAMTSVLGPTPGVRERVSIGAMQPTLACGVERTRLSIVFAAIGPRAAGAIVLTCTTTVAAETTTTGAVVHQWFGLESSAAEGRIGGERVDEWGVGIDIERRALGRIPASRWVIGSEMRVALQIGQGSGGIKLFGPADLELSLDYLVPVAQDHGAFGGLALRAEGFLTPSWILGELPRVEAGYQWQGASVLLRALAFAGYVVGSGSIDTVTDGSTSEPEFGGRAVAAVTVPMTTYAAVDVRHVPRTSASSGIPLDEITGSACSTVVRGLVACARAAYYRGTTRGFFPAEAQWRLWSVDLVLTAF